MPAIHRLLYLSRATRPMTPAEIDELLDRSRTRNAAAGLTGALLHYDGHFLQVLEGDGDAVADTFERIRRDPRHADVLPLIDGAATQRSFAGWAMRYVPATAPGDRAVIGFLKQLRSQPAPEVVLRALALMERLTQPPAGASSAAER